VTAAVERRSQWKSGSPRGNHGEKVNGVLYLDDFSFRTFSGDEQMAVPYSYTIK
jgi:hypothetical protein